MGSREAGCGEGDNAVWNDVTGCLMYVMRCGATSSGHQRQRQCGPARAGAGGCGQGQGPRAGEGAGCVLHDPSHQLWVPLPDRAHNVQVRALGMLLEAVGCG